MKIRYDVEDGYVGQERPHYMTLDDTILDGFETDDEYDDYIEEQIRANYEAKISFRWSQAS